MTIEECYKKMGANCQDVIKRLPSVSMIEKFALKFREDTSFQELETALNEKQVDLAFRAAHTLKGVCMNLGFDHLYKPSFEITESLRASNLDLALQQFDAVKEQYSKTIAALNEFAA
ncbi:Hpt domain-containing protein [uncultured Holdemanella sp.]|uniref:Hpt domain-containing protein n=1 Tax=uncultured Holdemanella sp. TaxID=1763549 RepID=UPI002659803A|nr:Hpt domain-containing protein [uncultured Holdemanella sp.]